MDLIVWPLVLVVALGIDALRELRGQLAAWGWRSSDGLAGSGISLSAPHYMPSP